MASWTDNPSLLGNFNPFIQTLPVEALSQVGMIKQEQFDAGVQKVQGWVDSISGLPIAKEEIKSYVQTKLGQLKEGVTKSLAGDFSDQRIVNQIGGAAKIIARDPIVQNGVQSTARMQSALSEMGEAKKAGKSAPQNEAYLQNSINSWVNDGQLDSQFTGSYTPYIDITDRFVKLYKEQNPGEDIPNGAFRTDENGNTQVNPVLFKGKSPEKIQSLFNLISSQPDVQNQLRIDGWWKYRGVTQNQLGYAITESTNSALADNQRAIQSLQAKLSLGSGDTAKISAQIDELKRQDVAKRKSYASIASLIKSNPEQAKAELAREEMSNSLMNAYSYQTMEKSPLWETSMQERVFNREFYEWQQTYDQNERKFAWEKQKDIATLQAKANKAGSTGAEDTITSGQIVSSEIPTGSTKAYEDLKSSADEYGQSIFELVGRMAHGGNDSPTALNSVTGKWEYNFGPDKMYKTLEAAVDGVATLYAHAKDSYINGGIEDAAANALMERVNQKNDNYQANQQIVLDVENAYKEQLKAVGVNKDNEDYVNFALYSKKVDGWEKIKSNLVSKYGPDFEKAMGIGHSNTSGSGVVTYEKGANYNKLVEAEKLVNNRTSNILADREESFLRRQNTEIPYTVTHSVAEKKDREAINTRFNALARARAVNPETGKGDAADILELTGKQYDKREGLQYRSGVDPQTGRAWIEVSDGTSSKTMEVSRAEYERQFPERVYNNQFRETFGARLNQTKWTSTDPLGDSNGGGRANAYNVSVDKKDFPFVIQYHLVSQGPNQYAMRWWVTPKPSQDNPSPTPIINGEYASGTLVGMPETLTEEEVVRWKEKLKDSNWLQGQLTYKFRK